MKKLKTTLESQPGLSLVLRAKNKGPVLKSFIKEMCCDFDIYLPL